MVKDAEFWLPCPKADDKQRIDQLVEQLEALNPTAAPMRDPSCVAGEWRVLYSTIKITVC